MPAPMRGKVVLKVVSVTLAKTGLSELAALHRRKGSGRTSFVPVYGVRSYRKPGFP